ncbi:MAG: hypothetical protein JSV74_05175 [Dehalococcoidia bacterium]|nr:MAG: hypothetical protein JSV74_05175 [Dehalococcoidia bacterium]
MMRIIKRLGIVGILIVVLLVAFSGSIFAAGGNPEKGNGGEECPYGDCNCRDCEPKTYAFKWGNETESLGPYGPHAYKHGKTTE